MIAGNVAIRGERPADHDAIYELVKEAFSTAPVKDGGEQDFVNELRSGPGYIPGLALVAEEDGALVGHIMLTVTKIRGADSEHNVLLLAPLCVELSHRNRGIGGALIKESFLRAMDLGYNAVVLVGEPLYYHRFGFVSASRFGIHDKKDIPEGYLMAVELRQGALNGCGGVVDVC